MIIINQYFKVLHRHNRIKKQVCIDSLFFMGWKEWGFRRTKEDWRGGFVLIFQVIKILPMKRMLYIRVVLLKNVSMRHIQIESHP